MCSGAEMMMFGNTVQAVSSIAYSQAQTEGSKADAAAERDAASQHAEKILRATNKQRAAARAATAASGTRVDEFSLGVEQEILEAGETDAAMTILGADRRARTLRTQAKLQTAAGYGEAGGSLFRAAYAKGWKSPKEPTTGDFSRMDRGYE